MGKTLVTNNGLSITSEKSESSITQKILHQDIIPRLTNLPKECVG